MRPIRHQIDDRLHYWVFKIELHTRSERFHALYVRHLALVITYNAMPNFIVSLPQKALCL